MYAKMNHFDTMLASAGFDFKNLNQDEGAETLEEPELETDHEFVEEIEKTKKNIKKI